MGEETEETDVGLDDGVGEGVGGVTDVREAPNSDWKRLNNECTSWSIIFQSIVNEGDARLRSRASSAPNWFTGEATMPTTTAPKNQKPKEERTNTIGELT